MERCWEQGQSTGAGSVWQRSEGPCQGLCMKGKQWVRDNHSPDGDRTEGPRYASICTETHTVIRGVMGGEVAPNGLG